MNWSVNIKRLIKDLTLCYTFQNIQLSVNYNSFFDRVDLFTEIRPANEQNNLL